MYTGPVEQRRMDSDKNRQSELKWFATRAVMDRSYVQKYLSMYGFELSRIESIPSLFFIRTDANTLKKLRYGDLLGHIFVYCKPGVNEPEPVPEISVKTIRILASFRDENVIYMAVDDPKFFEGRRKRVVEGVFKGCEGVIKRIKGERRLVVKISEKAAIATAYIPKAHLVDIE